MSGEGGLASYRRSILEEFQRLLEVARAARARGLDPEPEPESRLAHDVASLVEGMTGPPGVAKRIRELARQMEKDELAFKAIVDWRWAHLVYHGMAYHPLKEELDAFIERSQRPVEGRYRVLLYKGNVEILERSSPKALFFPELRSIKEGGFDQRICAHAARIFGLTFETLARREA